MTGFDDIPIPDGADGVLEKGNVFPVKGFAPADVPLIVTPRGLKNDRIAAFERLSTQKTRYVAGKQGYGLSNIVPIVDPESTHMFPPTITIQLGGETLPLHSPEVADLVSKLAPRYARSFALVYNMEGMPDLGRVSLMSRATADYIAQGVEDERVTVDRFRMNLQVRWRDESPMFEHSLVGGGIELRIGEDGPRFTVESLVGRCHLMNYDPESGTVNEAVLDFIRRDMGGKAGVYLKPTIEGAGKELEPGQGVYIERFSRE